jgi:hypothetical protein
LIYDPQPEITDKHKQEPLAEMAGLIESVKVVFNLRRKPKSIMQLSQRVPGPKPQNSYRLSN